MSSNHDIIEMDMVSPKYGEGDHDKPLLKDKKVQNLYRTLFQKCDADRDGLVTVKELYNLLKYNSKLSKRDVQKLHQQADINGDGQLSLDEFIELMKNNTMQEIFREYLQRYVTSVIPKKRKSGEDETDTSYEEQYSCYPPKVAMLIISFTEIIFFAYDAIVDPGSTDFGDGPAAELCLYDPKKRYQAWRFITYALTHIGYMHLVVNIAVQLLLGIPLEMVHGGFRVLAVYFSGIVAGSLGTSLTDPYTRLAGASGGVYAIFTAHISTILMNWKEISLAWVQMLLFLFIIVSDLGISIYNRYNGNNQNIGYVAHLAGAFAGICVGIDILVNLRVTKWEKWFKWIALIAFHLFLFGAIAANIFWTDHYPKPN